MYNHFFKLNKESEAISNISRNLSKYSYNNESINPFVETGAKILNSRLGFNSAIRSGISNSEALTTYGATKLKFSDAVDNIYIDNVRNDISILFKKNNIDIDISRLYINNKSDPLTNILAIMKKHLKARKVNYKEISASKEIVKKLAPEINEILIKRTSEYLARLDSGIDKYVNSSEFRELLINGIINKKHSELITEIKEIANFKVFYKLASNRTNQNIETISDNVFNSIFEKEIYDILHGKNIPREAIEEFMLTSGKDLNLKKATIINILNKLKTVNEPLKETGESITNASERVAKEIDEVANININNSPVVMGTSSNHPKPSGPSGAAIGSVTASGKRADETTKKLKDKSDAAWGVIKWAGGIAAALGIGFVGYNIVVNRRNNV